MKQAQSNLEVKTNGRGLIEITSLVADWAKRQEIENGLLTLFIRHTSASLLIQENADANVLVDLENFFQKIAPEDPTRYRHREEGLDDMPAHIRSALTQSNLSIPIAGKRLCLGTWQGIYVCEHRSGPHVRQLVLHLLGEILP